MADVATQTSDPNAAPDRSQFPYSGPGDQDSKLPAPTGSRGRQGASPTGPFPTWPPPWRTARVQNFVRSLPDRPFQMWGRPGQFPAEPQPWQTHAIYQGVGSTLSSIGSGFVAPMAMAMNTNAGAFMKGFTQGQEELQKIRHQQMTDYAEETALRLEQEMSEYRDAFSAFGGDPSTGTGADPKLTLKGVGNLWQALYAVARQYDDKYMMAALDSGNLASAENILKNRDASHRDLRGGIAAQKKDEAEREKEAPYLAPGSQPQSQAGPPATTQETPAETPEPSSDEGATPAPTPAEPPAATTTGAPQEGAPPADTFQPSLEPLAQAPRPQGVQVAEGGASDAPPVWPGQLARQRQAQPFHATEDTILPNAKD